MTPKEQELIASLILCGVARAYAEAAARQAIDTENDQLLEHLHNLREELHTAAQAYAYSKKRRRIEVVRKLLEP